MEIKVTVGFEKQAAEILNKLIEVLEQKTITVIPKTVVPAEEKKPELVIQPELINPATPAEETSAEETVPAPVPTSAPSYSLADLQKAAGELVNAGKSNVLLGVLREFGVAALTMLPKEKYGDFAQKIREFGGNI